MRRALGFLAPRAACRRLGRGRSCCTPSPSLRGHLPRTGRGNAPLSRRATSRSCGAPSPPPVGEVSAKRVGEGVLAHRAAAAMLCLVARPRRRHPAGLPTTRTDLTAERPRPRRGDHQADHRFLQARAVRADAGRRRHVEEARQPGRLLAILRQHHLRGRRHVQARQRAVPQALGVVAVLDAGLGRARAAVQRARLPELPSEGRPRPSAGRQCRRHLDVPAAGARRRDRGGEAGASPTAPCSTSPTRSMAGSCRILPCPALPARAGWRSPTRKCR